MKDIMEDRYFEIERDKKYGGFEFGISSKIAYLSFKEYSELIHSNCEKDKEIERLNNIINNAKTFIQESCYDYDYDTYSNMFSTEVKELVDILGSDKE